MSRLGKKPITLLDGVTVASNNGRLNVTGPKGSLSVHIPAGVNLEVTDGKVSIKTDNPVYMGTVAALIKNNMIGVVSGWTKVLELNGTGYRANVVGSSLNLSLGLSHPVSVAAPEGVTFEVKETKITVSGNDKVTVGEIAAKIRALRPADVYKAKGFKYENEVILRKAGKAAKAGGAK